MIYKVFLVLTTLFSCQIALSRHNHLKEPPQCPYGQIPFGNTCEDCGKRFAAPNIRIVGGEPAVKDSWPSHVLIVQNIKGRFSAQGKAVRNQYMMRRCGGTLINRFTILTAANCIKNVGDYLNLTTIYASSAYSSLEDSFDVYAGANDISFLQTGVIPPSVLKLKVSKIIRNPYYNRYTIESDLALFILSNGVTFNNNIQPACLPDPSLLNYPVEDADVYAVGWGQLKENDLAFPVALQNVRLLTYTKMTCDNLIKRYGFDININNSFCAGRVNSGQDACNGDTGGGLYFYDTNLNKNILVGIRSFGIGCARNDTLGIYTRVNYYNNIYNQWITDNWVTEGEIFAPEKLPPIMKPIIELFGTGDQDPKKPTLNIIIGVSVSIFVLVIIVIVSVAIHIWRTKARTLNESEKSVTEKHPVTGYVIFKE